MPRNEYLELADWRRRVAALFDAWRTDAALDPGGATAAFRAAKDRLFAEHPQSPLPEADRPAFRGLPYWPYDPAWRMVARFEPDPGAPAGPDAVPAPSAVSATPFGGGLSLAPAGPIALPNSGSGVVPFRRIGRVALEGPLAGHSLAVYWIDAYGGGIFLPFRDATSGAETYGAGRYLLDTIKSADHGGDAETGTLLLDFNLAYHPSCAYDPRWSCPLAPPESRLAVTVRAGERLAGGH